MKEILIKVCGDHWLNPQEVRDTLKNVEPGTPILLNMSTEGACLQALGIQDAVLEYCTAQQVTVANWPNPVDTVFRRTHTPRLSHFFWMCQRYWLSELSKNTHQYKFALFVGRRTTSRIKMLFDMFCNFRNQALLSAMNTNTPDPLIDADIKIWWDQKPIPSIDNHAVSDQYNPVHNTNLDLLEYYHKFDIEIVAESYTLGNTFFPTEKTVRPIMAAKPMLVYGPGNFLARLRELGFETYSNFWSEDYDQFEGPDRWQRMLQILPGVNLTPEVHAVALRNRQHLAQLILKYQPQ